MQGLFVRAPAVSCCLPRSFQRVLCQVEVLGRSVGVGALGGAQFLGKEQRKVMWQWTPH